MIPTELKQLIKNLKQLNEVPNKINRLLSAIHKERLKQFPNEYILLLNREIKELEKLIEDNHHEQSTFYFNKLLKWKQTELKNLRKETK